MKKIFFSLLLFILVQTSYAAEFEKLDLPTQPVNPGDFYYSAVRLWEKIAEKSQFDNKAKYKYLSFLIDKRMSELGFIIKKDRWSEIQRSTERLSYQVGVTTEFLIKQKDKDKKEQLKAKINNFLPALEELRDKHAANSSFWLLVQHDINSLKEYSEKLN